MSDSKKKKRPTDINQLAASIVKAATEGEPVEEEKPTVTRARKAGEKGGPARSASLTPEQRAEIARKAAKARWGSR